jgi:hypothetical protein
MMLYRPLSVDLDPVISIAFWSIWEVDDGEHPKTRHISGRTHNDPGRMSSLIVSIEDGVIITRSGRRYMPVGKPGDCLDAAYVREAWCKANKIIETKDVTDEYASLLNIPSPVSDGAAAGTSES